MAIIGGALLALCIMKARAATTERAIVGWGMVGIAVTAAYMVLIVHKLHILG